MSDEFSASDRDEAPPSSRLPDLDFSTFVMSIIGSAFVHLGEAPYPDGSAQGANLVLAQQDIDLLVLLQKKTKGNLSGVEEQVLDQGLYDLRIRFVEVAREQG